MVDGERFRLTPELRLQLLALLAQDDEPGIAMTYDEFLNWADEDTLAEWVNGKVVMTSLASLRHQLIAQFLGRVLAGYVEVGGLGIVVSALFQMKLEQSGREPDALFVAEAHRGRLHTTYLDGPADLVVEILSPESIGRDRGEKFYEYERAGIPEYWLIDDATQRAEFYQLDEHGRYQLIAPGADGAYHSKALPGFWLEVAWLWRDPLPSVEQTLLAIAGERYAQYLLQQLRQQGFIPLLSCWERQAEGIDEGSAGSAGSTGSAGSAGSKTRLEGEGMSMGNERQPGDQQARQARQARTDIGLEQ